MNPVISQKTGEAPGTKLCIPLPAYISNKLAKYHVRDFDRSAGNYVRVMSFANDFYVFITNNCLHETLLLTQFLS